MQTFIIYICAFHKHGSYGNGGHRTSNGYVYQYTEIDKTSLCLSLPFMLLNDSIKDLIKDYFAGCTNREIIYTDWNDESIGVSESELDISELLFRLGKTFCMAPYPQFVFKHGNRELCPFEIGDRILIPLTEEHEDMR